MFCVDDAIRIVPKTLITGDNLSTKSKCADDKLKMTGYRYYRSLTPQFELVGNFTYY